MMISTHAAPPSPPVSLIEDQVTERPLLLPRGLRQGEVIASILALHPKVIHIDEPTTHRNANPSVAIMDFL